MPQRPKQHRRASGHIPGCKRNEETDMKVETPYPLPYSGLEEKIGYCFRTKKLLETALTHSSYSNEVHTRGSRTEFNERLEFLGDSVLSFVTSEYLYNTFPQLPEGELSTIRAGTVCEKALHAFALEIGLGSYLLLGHGEERNNGRARASILADAFEALLAAMFLDGGIDAVKHFLLPFITSDIGMIVKEGNVKDYKTELQHVIQAEQGEKLTYVTVSETGPAHAKTFTVEARLNSNIIGHGSGSSKREAEQNAAMEALKLFGMT